MSDSECVYLGRYMYYTTRHITDTLYTYWGFIKSTFFLFSVKVGGKRIPNRTRKNSEDVSSDKPVQEEENEEEDLSKRFVLFMN